MPKTDETVADILVHSGNGVEHVREDSEFMTDSVQDDLCDIDSKTTQWLSGDFQQYSLNRHIALNLLSRGAPLLLEGIP